MDNSYLILTDSGGVQEEAPSLNVPVLVARDKTERPEGIKAGSSILVGRNKENINKELVDLDGIIVAPGFGQRGLDGKILAVEYSRINKIPFLGICFGMQMAVIEYARNVKKIGRAHV